MMTDAERGFLKAICDDPADDHSRLVYADWLDEHPSTRQCPRCRGTGGRVIDGSAWDRFTCGTCDGAGTVTDTRNATRAELIRVQVELAQPFRKPCRSCGRAIRNDRVADGCPCNSPRGINHGNVPAYVCTCPECDPEQTGSVRARPVDVELLSAREAGLLEAAGFDVVNAPGWLPVRMTLGAHGTRLRIRRGFVEWWTMQGNDWLEYADRLTAVHPITSVTLTSEPQLEVEREFRGPRGEVYAMYKLRGRTKVTPGGGRDSGEICLELLRAEWPKVTFDTAEPN